MDDHLFTQTVHDDQKLIWFKEEFLENRDHKLASQEYAVRITEKEDNVFWGKLSRKHYHAMHPKTTDDIKDIVTEDWPYLEFLCDCSPGKQLIVIEYNSTVIYKISAMRTILDSLVSRAMFHHGYSVRFEPIIDDTTFWSIVEGSDGIYSLTFLLNSPNLFGAESEADKALEHLRGIFNNTRVKVTFDNESGRLKVPRKDIETYREYADKGGGEWTITTRTKGKKRRKKKHSSTQRALKISAEKMNDQTLATRLKAVYMNFLSKLK
ncbi:MAG: hypothetical protein NTZ78_04275 [Candidatus Aureabacteria bacterium]|nr:hypothetical protein [Candidatus Auribacterota bacterium]